MENASKALVMVGSVLISLMIIGALLLTYNGIKNYQKTDTVDTTEAQITEFNNQFSTFNRSDVRGNDLYSLLNRAVDYNTRKTTSGTTKDAKEKLGYMPVTINMTFGNGVIVDNATNPFSANGVRNLIKSKDYIASEQTNTFQDEIQTEVKRIESTYGQTSANGLATGLTKIFIDDNSNTTETQKKKAIQEFNNASKKIHLSENEWNRIDKNSEIRKDIYKYYEYIQFKRAIFKCTKVEYDKSTGRIIQMDFEFTGKLQ